MQGGIMNNYSDAYYKAYNIKREIINGNYANARKMLNENKENKYMASLFGILENIENNFEKSKEYYLKSMKIANQQRGNILSLAKVYAQTGDYDVAINMIKSLLIYPEHKIQSLISLACIDIMTYDFYDAYNILNEIDTSTLSKRLMHHYSITKSYVEYFLGKLNKTQNNLDYTIMRLFDSDDILLLDHIKKHNNEKERYTNGCFIPDIDLKRLVYNVKERIEGMNANHFEISDMYRFKMDYPIGYKGDILTNDICVVTSLGLKNIITIYPVLLSNEFDQDNLLNSRELKIKRLQGGIK